MGEISDYIVSNPNVIWILTIIGAVAVIGVVDFCKCWVRNKKSIKWIVLFVSLAVAYILSPLVPPTVAAIIILFLLILAVSTIGRNAIVDGLPSLIAKAMGGEAKKENSK